MALSTSQPTTGFSENLSGYPNSLTSGSSSPSDGPFSMLTMEITNDEGYGCKTRMSEYQDPTFKERWPLLYKTIIKVYKIWGIIALVIGMVGLALFFLGGNPTTSSTVTSTAGNLQTTTVTTTTVNTLYKTIDDYIFWGIY